MARRRAKKLDFTFVAGLITEASPLTFPQNSSRDEENFILLRDGRRRRRKGIDLERGGVFPLGIPGAPLAGGNIASMERDWLNADGQSTADFTVVQTGKYVTFWRKDTPFTGNNLPNIIDLTNFIVPGATETQVRESHIEVAAGNGRLYVVGAYINPFYVEFIPGDPTIPTFDTITTTVLNLQERDFTDIPENVGLSNRPTTLTAAHEYNLKNSGWTEDLINAVFTARGNYPSLAETPYEGYLVDPATGKDIFDVDHLTAQLFGDSRSPRGHFIRDPFNTQTVSSSAAGVTPDNPITSVSFVSGTTWRIVTQNPHGLVLSDVFETDGNFISLQRTGFPIEPIDRSFDDHTNTVTNVISATSVEFTTGFGIPAGFEIFNIFEGKIAGAGSVLINPDGYVSATRPRATAFYTGRVWYAGTPDPNVGTKVFFSQIIERPEDAEKCYQQADPTSEHISDIVATDGGVINIPDIGEVFRMEPVWDSLLLFTDNGVWQIRGGNDVFFSPTNYLVRKVSNIEVQSPESLVIAEGSPVIWADEGIYLLQQGERGAIGALSLTEQSIQTLYQDIPDTCKHRASGEYDDVTKRIVWTYSSDGDNPGLHDLQLWFDARLKAWYKFRLPRSGDNVTDNVIGVARTEEHDQQESPLRFLTITSAAQNLIGWSDFTEENFIDWPFGEDPLDAFAYLETGFDTQSDPTIDKTKNLVFTYMERTDADNPSACSFATLWDWAFDGEFGNKTRTVEIYKEGMQRNVGNRVVVARNKVRGQGRAYHMRFETRPQRDCILIGWGVQVEGETDN